MNIKIDCLGIIRIPVWIAAFIYTWGTPSYWILLIIFLKDINWVFSFKK